MGLQHRSRVILATIGLVPVAAIGCWSAVAIARADQPIQLRRGSPIEREITGRQRHVYTVDLAAGERAQISVESERLDLTARLVDPQGIVAVEEGADADRYASSRQRLAVVARATGTYIVDVEPRYPKVAGAAYQITLEDVRAATAADLSLDDARRQRVAARHAYLADEYKQAADENARVRELLDRSPDATADERAAALVALGRVALVRADYGEAEALFQRARELDERAFGVDSAASADALDGLANAARSLAHFAEAEELGKRALAIRERLLGSKHFLVAVSLATLSDVYDDTRDFANATRFADRALEVAAASFDPADLTYAEYSSRVARARERHGDYAQAEHLYTQILDTRRALTGDHSLAVADTLYGLGRLHVDKRDNVTAEDFARAALAIRETILGSAHPQLAPILNNVALLAYRRMDYASADAMYGRAIAVVEKKLGPNHPLLQPSLNNLGLVAWKRHDYAKAAEYYQRALDICERAYGPDNYDCHYPLQNLGVVYKETGNYVRAEATYERVLAMVEKAHGPTTDLFSLVESLGVLHHDSGDYAGAKPLLARALELIEQSMGSDNPEAALAHHDHWQLYANLGDLQTALKHLQRATSIEEYGARLNLARGSEHQNLLYFAPLNDHLEWIVSFQVQQAAGDPAALDLAATTLLQRKGRILDVMASTLHALRERSNAEDRALIDRLDDVTTRLATTTLAGGRGRPLTEHEREVRALSDERSTLENELNRRSAGYFERSAPLTVTQVRTAIPDDAALIEFTRYRPFDTKKIADVPERWGEPRYLAYVVHGRGDVRWVDLGPAKVIDHDVSAWRGALADPKRDDARLLARELDRKVLQPLRGVLNGATHLLVSPEGQLNLIPFEAFVDERGQYVVENYSVTYLTAGRDLLRIEVPRTSRSAALIVADPLFGEPPALSRNDATLPTLGRKAGRRSITTAGSMATVYFAPLAGTRSEANAIHTLFPDARVMTGPAATESAIKAANAPRILHVATHGFFLEDTRIASENPLLRSGLALAGANLNRNAKSDGILTALEASSLNLWGTELVTLSACDTGIGEIRTGEGVYGLRRAFFLAGAASLVMSLWPVSDYVTRQMMTTFYTGLQHGLGRGEALRQAELAMLKRKGREHPFYWASFIQSGDWRPLN